MGTYVVGDIHGCYDMWIKLKNLIENQDPDAKFILVGDIVDRGPNMLAMIQWAMQNITPDGKYQMILGNHEDMKIDWWEAYNKLKSKYKKAGKQCGVDMMHSEHYGFDEWIVENELTDEYIDSVIDFFKSLPLIIEEDIKTIGDKTVHYIISHGSMSQDFINNDGTFNSDVLTDEYLSTRMFIGEKPKDSILWDRNFFGNSWEYNTITVHGHTPTIIRDLVVRGAVPGLIDFKSKDINIDCGAVFHNDGGQLAAIRLEDLEEFYVEGTYDNEYIREYRIEERNNHMMHNMRNTRKQELLAMVK